MSKFSNVQEALEHFGGVGSTVNVEHRADDMFNHDFTGQIAGIHGEFITVVDGDGDHWDCDPEQLSHNTDDIMHNE